MSTNSRVMSVSPSSVWASLADGLSYSSWVVGTKVIRDVDDGFPATGTALHYKVGRWPVQHKGSTKVIGATPGSRIELEVKAWPGLTVHIDIDIVALAPDRTKVTITEHPGGGAAGMLNNPAINLVIKLRNIETLRRLERVATLHGGLVAGEAVAASEAMRQKSADAPKPTSQ